MSDMDETAAARALDGDVGPGRPPLAHRFKPGNPGRPKGSRNKLSEAFIAALCADFDAHGAAAIARVRTEAPGVYLRVIARVVPASLMLESSGVLSEMSDEELADYLAAVRAALGVRDAVSAAGG